MTLRDRFDIPANPLRWWPIAFACGYLAGRQAGIVIGLRRGRKIVEDMIRGA